MTLDFYIEKEDLCSMINNLKNTVSSGSVLFYGAGIAFNYVAENYNLDKFNVIGISDRKFTDNELGAKYFNYDIIPVSYINRYNPDYIVVTAIEADKIIQSLKKTLTNNEIKIIPMFSGYNSKYKLLNYVTKVLKEKNFDVVKYDTEKHEVIFSDKDVNILTDVTYPWIAGEIFGLDIYKFKSEIDMTKKYSVLDIGANRCYASVYFAQKEWVKDVYAFELVPQTAEFAKKNIELNPKYKDKIKLYPFGLGKENTETAIQMLTHRDGCNTMMQEFFDNYMPEEQGKGIIQKCDVRKSSQVLRKIIEENVLDNIIFKIDAEGAEYDIMEDLKDNYPQIFDKIEILIGDTHLGFERFYNLLPKNKFKIVYANKQEDGCCPFEIAKIR